MALPAARGLRAPRVAGDRCDFSVTPGVHASRSPVGKTRELSEIPTWPGQAPRRWLTARSARPSRSAMEARSVVPGKFAVVRRPLLQEGVAALHCFFTAVGEARRFAGEQLLADQAFVGQVEAVLQHAHRGRALLHDELAPIERRRFELGVRHDRVDHAHLVRFLRAVVLTQEEDFARALLTNLTSEQRGAVAAVEAGDVGIGLLEDGVLSTGD